MFSSFQVMLTPQGTGCDIQGEFLQETVSTRNCYRELLAVISGHVWKIAFIGFNSKNNHQVCPSVSQCIAACTAAYAVPPSLLYLSPPVSICFYRVLTVTVAIVTVTVGVMLKSNARLQRPVARSSQNADECTAVIDVANFCCPVPALTRTECSRKLRGAVEFYD